MECSMNEKISWMIRERFHEHHPFKSGGEGMRHFAQVVKYFESCDDKEKLEYIEQAEKLIDHLKGCNCTPKLYVYLKIMCQQVDSERFKKYNEMLQDYLRRSTDRNYEQEVMKVISDCPKS